MQGVLDLSVVTRPATQVQVEEERSVMVPLSINAGTVYTPPVFEHLKMTNVIPSATQKFTSQYTTHSVSYFEVPLTCFSVKILEHLVIMLRNGFHVFERSCSLNMASQ